MSVDYDVVARTLEVNSGIDKGNRVLAVLALKVGAVVFGVVGGLDNRVIQRGICNTQPAHHIRVDFPQAGKVPVIALRIA